MTPPQNHEKTRDDWQRLISDFEASMQARGLAHRTVEHYSDVLGRVLVGYCQREGIAPRDLTKRHLERLSAQLLSGGRSRQTVRTYLSAINTFFTWCQAEGELGPLSAPRPSVERRLLEVLSRAEIQMMEDAASSERDKLIVRVLADAGLRLGELRRLTLDDLLSEGRERYLRVRGQKVHRDRKVPLKAGVYARLERFARRARPEAASDRLFLTQVRGRSGDYEPVAESTVGQLIGSLGRKADIKRHVNPHLFRHSLATHLLRKGENPIVVRDILGHSSLAMIDQVYSHLTTSDAHHAMMRALSGEEE